MRKSLCGLSVDHDVFWFTVAWLKFCKYQFDEESVWNFAEEGRYIDTREWSIGKQSPSFCGMICEKQGMMAESSIWYGNLTFNL